MLQYYLHKNRPMVKSKPDFLCDLSLGICSPAPAILRKAPAQLGQPIPEDDFADLQSHRRQHQART